eukprot:COSAG06_NODE_852_length_11954_cov_6.453986_2_plen_80_part_00
MLRVRQAGSRLLLLLLLRQVVVESALRRRIRPRRALLRLGWWGWRRRTVRGRGKRKREGRCCLSDRRERGTGREIRMDS